MKNTISECVNGFNRYLTINPPWDKRPKYGIGALSIFMVVQKENKAVEFTCSTGTHLPHNTMDLAQSLAESLCGMGYNVGYHSPYPMFEGQKPACDDCEYTGGVCYTDGSSLRAGEWYADFIEKGIDYIWSKLEQDWEDRFGDIEDKS
jgi:hypothetical protein